MAITVKTAVVLAAVTIAQTSQPLTSGNPKIDQILGRLETAGNTIKDLACKVTYTQLNPLIEDKVVKTGEIFGLNGLTDGSTRSEARKAEALRRADARGFKGA